MLLTKDTGCNRKKSSSVRWYTQLKFLPYFKWVQKMNFTYTSYLPTLLKCYNITKCIYLARVHISSTCTCTCTWCLCHSSLLHNLRFWMECVNPSEPVFCNINQSWSMLFWFICLLQIQIKILFDWFTKLAKIWMWLLPSVFKISVKKLLCLNGSVGVLVYCIRFWSCEGLSYENNEKLNIVFFNVVTKRIT